MNWSRTGEPGERRRRRTKPILSGENLGEMHSTDSNEWNSNTGESGQLPQDWKGSTSSITRETALHREGFSSASTEEENFRNPARTYSCLPSYLPNDTHNSNQPPAYATISNDRSTTDQLRSSYQSIVARYINHTRRSQNTVNANDTDGYGLIILGNSGVGKSFLANTLLGSEAFLHEVRSSSVTHRTDFIETGIGDIVFAIFDIPGLIEADQRRIDLNKKEIDKAFLQRPNSIILYVFGNQNGRIREEDIVAFKAINAAYSFQREALVIVINDLPQKRARDYEGTTLVLLKQLLPNVVIGDGNTCFLDRINPDDPDQKQILKERLLKVVVDFTPKVHRKTQEIETLLNRLETEKHKIRDQQTQFEAERLNFLKEIARSQKLLNEAIANHQTEAESYKRALQRQEKMFRKQQEEFEKERRQYYSQLEDLRKQTNQAYEHYEKLCKDGNATNKALQDSHDAYKSLKASLDQFSKQQLPAKQKSRCVIV